MKKTLLIAIMAIVSALTMQAQTGWEVPDDNEYAKHIVVNAVLKTPSGTALGSLGNEYTPAYLGAFIDGACRAKSTQLTYGSVAAVEGYYYQLRIGVDKADAGKDITFKLSVSNTEYTLSVPTPLTASNEDKTVGTLSDLYVINYNPVISISSESQVVHVNMDETVNMLGLVKFVALDGSAVATLPDTLPWEYSNSQDYLSIENNVLTPLQAGKDVRHVGLGFDTGYIADGNTSSYVGSTFGIYIHQPITSIALNEGSSYYKDGRIEVNVNDQTTLTAALADIITIQPANTTESVKWTLTKGTENGIVEVEGDETTYWNPAIVGEYEMTASYGELAPVVVPVKVIQPATEINQTQQLITVILGDDVTQYLPYTFSIVPSDATYQLDGITYSLTESETGVLTQDDSGNIKAATVGRSSVAIKHRDLPNLTVYLSVEVVDFPTKNDYTISADPLSISLKDMELSKLDIYEQLCNNVIGNTSLTKMLAQNFTFSEVGENPILAVYAPETASTTTVMATKYGNTNVQWSYAVKAAKIEDGGFNPSAEYTHTLGYSLQIVAGLNSITIEPMTIGLTDTGATIKLTTNPEGMQLAESDITWTDAVTNYLEIGDRVEGKNEWKVTPLQIADKHTMTIQYTDKEVNCVGGNLTITQRLHLEEGWHWTSLYTGGLSDISTENEKYNTIQEIRSRSQVTYNDAKYGFFGALKEMTTDEGYKVNIKSGAVLDTLVAITNWIGVDTQKSTTLSQKWNWVSNPYCFNHDLNAALGKATGWANDSRIISKDGGFATIDAGNGGWTGTLTTLVAGEAYLIYNAATESLSLAFPAEQDLEAVATSSEVGTLSARTKSPWKYDSRRFADNMSIIARATTSLEEGRYSIGAFVGDECRGEGVMINGRFFITVHGAGGEKVSFKLYDNNSGQIINLDEEMNFAMTAGTLSEPVALNTPFISGVDGVNANANIDIRFVGDDIVVAGVDENDVEVYNTNGVRVSPTGLAKGVYVVKVGAVTRKMIKR